MKETLESKDVVSHTKSKTKPKKKFIKSLFLLVSYIVVALVVWKLTLKTQDSPEYQQSQVKKQIEATVKKVQTIAVLPQDETPQVAIIQDVEILKKNQPFFMDAQNGDKVLVYTQARKAIIYREGEHKIVNIALNIGAEDTATPAPTAPAPEVDEQTKEATTTEEE